MISEEELIEYIQDVMPDADVTVQDLKGTLDHFRLRIISKAFDGQNLLDRQRFVYQALSEPMKDGRIHALEIRSQTPAEVV